MADHLKATPLGSAGAHSGFACSAESSARAGMRVSRLAIARCTRRGCGGLAFWPVAGIATGWVAVRRFAGRGRATHGRRPGRWPSGTEARSALSGTPRGMSSSSQIAEIYSDKAGDQRLRTCRLRVRCSEILFLESTSVFTLARWRDARNFPGRSTVCGRPIPRSTGTSEQTWSKHGSCMV